MAEIPFWFHDRPKWVSGIGRHTTCQDILTSLLKAHANKKVPSADPKDNDVSKLVLVEQWRGVERPLSNASRILKLWSAWGEERGQVRFVVKRLSESSTALQVNTNSLSRNSISSRKTRRRNSRLSSHDAVLHPSAFKSSSSTDDIERLMRIILTQGETIHTQLKRLQEREGQIETIEEEVHKTRTKTAGKDYLLNAYLEGEEDKGGSKDEECLQEVLEALEKVHRLNEDIFRAEERFADLKGKMKRSVSVEDLEAEVARMRAVNDDYGREIDANKASISSMRSAFEQRRALVRQLENDVGKVESEGIRLQLELRNMFDDDLEDDDEEEDELRFRLSSSQLYEDKQLQQQSYKLMHVETTVIGSSERTSNTGSPGSSSSGCGTGSEKSLRSKTPDLPPIPPGDFPMGPKLYPIPPGDFPMMGPKLYPNTKQFTKSILKSVDPSGDLDSNSDTGLSSLHSSSDEGTYVLDTLV